MQGFTPDLLDLLSTNFSAGIAQLSLVIAALPSDASTPPPESAEIIRMIIATVAEKIAILKEPTSTPLSKAMEEDLMALQPAMTALASMAGHPKLLRYYDHIIYISAGLMKNGEGSTYIARVLNSLAAPDNTDIHLSMLGHQILALTLAAFKTQATAYYALTLSSENNEERLKAQSQLSQHGMLLFKLLKFTSAPTEKFKIKIRDDIREMLELDRPTPSHLPLAIFLGSIQTTSTYSIKRPHTSPFWRGHASPDSSATTIPQTALTLSGSGSGSGLSASRSVSPIQHRGSLHRIDSTPRF